MLSLLSGSVYRILNWLVFLLFVFWGKIFGGVSPVLSKYGEI